MMQLYLQGAKSANIIIKSVDISTVIIDEVHKRSVQSDYALALTLASMQTTSRIRLVLMCATGDHKLVEKRIPFCQRIVLSGAMRQIKRIFMEQPIVHSDHLLFNIAQVVIARHNKRAGLPLVEHASRKDGSTIPSSKIMVFVPGVRQIRQLHEMLQRAFDSGWTWGLIP